MGFKENLLMKIRIDRLADAVVRSLSGTDAARYDKASMEELLEIGGYRHVRERDMDLFILSEKMEKSRILSLDNGLAIYESTIEDVVMRKSPTVKEMLSFRNAYRILNDADVLRTKREDSVRVIQKELVDRLDLSFKREDIDGIRRDGVAALDGGYGEGVLEALDLFTELLDLKKGFGAFQAPHHDIRGWVKTSATGKRKMGPIVILSRMENRLQLIEEPVSPDDAERMQFFQAVVAGNGSGDRQGAAVFQYLADRVMAGGK